MYIGITASVRSESTFLRNIVLKRYETVADVPESWVWVRADLQSGFRVLKKVFWIFLSMAHNVISCRKVAENIKFWKLLNSLYKNGSRPQKSPKIPQKTLHSIAICSKKIWMIPGESSCPSIENNIPQCVGPISLTRKCDIRIEIVCFSKLVPRWRIGSVQNKSYHLRQRWPFPKMLLGRG